MHEASGMIALPETEKPPVLEVTGLRKHFGDQVALDGVDLKIYEGEVVAVLGPSGSGKSTLVRCIDQLESIDGGAMFLDGELLGTLMLISHELGAFAEEGISPFVAQAAQVRSSMDTSRPSKSWAQPKASTTV